MADSRSKLIFEAEISNAKQGIADLRKAVAEGATTIEAAAKGIKDYNKVIRDVGTVAENTSSIFGKMAQQFTVGTLAAGALSTGISVLKDIVKESSALAEEHEKQIILLNSALQNAGPSFQGASRQVQEMSRALEDQTGISEDLIIQGFTRMTTALIPLNAQYAMMKGAEDIAAASGKDVNEVLIGMIKASNGVPKLFNQIAASLGIVREKGESVASFMDRTMNAALGRSTAVMQTLEGESKRLHAEIEHGQKTWGEYFDIFVGGTIKLVRTNELVSELADTMAKGESFDKFFNGASAAENLDKVNQMISDVSWRMAVMPGFAEEGAKALEKLYERQGQLIKQAKDQHEQEGAVAANNPKLDPAEETAHQKRLAEIRLAGKNTGDTEVEKAESAHELRLAKIMEDTSTDTVGSTRARYEELAAEREVYSRLLEDAEKKDAKRQETELQKLKALMEKIGKEQLEVQKNIDKDNADAQIAQETALGSTFIDKKAALEAQIDATTNTFTKARLEARLKQLEDSDQEDREYAAKNLEIAKTLQEKLAKLNEPLPSGVQLSPELKKEGTDAATNLANAQREKAAIAHKDRMGKIARDTTNIEKAELDTQAKNAVASLGQYNQALSRLLVMGGSFKDFMKNLAQSVAISLIQHTLEGIEVAILTKLYAKLAAAKAASTLGISAGPSIAGAASVWGALGYLFDDPVNDARLKQENRRIARFSTEGIAEGVKEINDRQGAVTAPTSNVKIGDMTINIHGNANQSTIDQLRLVLTKELPQLIKDGVIQIPTTQPYRAR